MYATRSTGWPVPGERRACHPPGWAARALVTAWRNHSLTTMAGERSDHQPVAPGQRRASQQGEDVPADVRGITGSASSSRRIWRWWSRSTRPIGSVLTSRRLRTWRGKPVGGDGRFRIDESAPGHPAGEQHGPADQLSVRWEPEGAVVVGRSGVLGDDVRIDRLPGQVLQELGHRAAIASEGGGQVGCFELRLTGHQWWSAATSAPMDTARPYSVTIPGSGDGPGPTLGWCPPACSSIGMSSCSKRHPRNCGT